MRLPEFKSETLNFKMATLEDVPNLMKIGLSWTEKQETEGDAFSEEELRESITNGSLPPIEGVSVSNFGLYIIETLDTTLHNQPVGLLELYKGYPDASTLWIGLLIIDSEYRRHHYGTQVIEALKRYSRELDCEALGIGVSLKNWRGLRFWHSVGFREITKITGTKDYSPTEQAIVALKQTT